MLRRLLLPALVLLALGAVPAARAQIVDTLGGWNDDESGWSGRLGLTGSLSGGNTDVKGGSGAARAQWRGEAWLLRLLGSFRLEEANGVRAREESMSHVRVARPGDSRWTPFAFGQSQRNPFRRLETRLLLGAGAAYDLVRDEKQRLAIGASPMLEYEKISDGGEGSRGRFSCFVRWTADLSDGVSSTLQGFYQPRLSDPADARASASGSLRTRIAGPVSFLVSGSYERDDQPPDGVDPDDWDLEFGVTLDL
jgi:hypothetical protein